jgi:ABC-2 type transport system ATP-binding protein
MNQHAIHTRNLQKSYDGNTALRGLDLSVPEGSIYGFLGRNGAGKTTTMKLLLGLLRRDAGEIFLFGKEISSEAAAIEARRQIGFVSEEKTLYPFMNVGQVINFTRPFFPGWRRDLEEKYLQLFRLPLKRSITRLSKGMNAQLMLLLAMARGARLLMLDEPTSGLDPIMTEEVLRELADLAAQDGATIFFSSHQLTEVEQICDHVCLIDHGQAVLAGNLDDLKSSYHRVVLTFDEEPHQFAAPEMTDHLRRNGRTISLLTHGDAEAIAAEARSQGARNAEIHAVSLRELFLDHVKGA